MIGEPEWTDQEYELYDQQFSEAYQNRQVLLNQAAMLGPFAAAVPHNPSMEEEMDYVDYLETLLTQEAFAIEEKAVFRFVAEPLPVKHAKEPVSFKLPDGLLVTIESLSVSVDQIGLKLRITRPGSDQPLTLDDWRGWEIAVFAQDAETRYDSLQYGPEDDGSLRYIAHSIINNPTDQIVLIPVEKEMYNEVIRQGGAVTKEQQDRILRIDLE